MDEEERKQNYEKFKKFLNSNMRVKNSLVELAPSEKDNYDEIFKKIIDVCYLEEVLAKKVFKEHTLLLNEAYDLSGGERQRIILARMLAHMKNILMVDEPLSEVSIEVEKKIIANIIKNYPKVTLIYISHRRVEDCFDRVLYV